MSKLSKVIKTVKKWAQETSISDLLQRTVGMCRKVSLNPRFWGPLSASFDQNDRKWSLLGVKMCLLRSKLSDFPPILIMVLRRVLEMSLLRGVPRSTFLGPTFLPFSSKLTLSVTF